MIALLIAGFVAFNEYTGGRPLPNTFYAKNYGMGTAVSLAEGRPLDALLDVVRYPVNLLGDAIRWQASHDALLFGVALLGLLALVGALGRAGAAGGRALLAVLVLTPIAKGLVAPQPVMLVHDGRYVLHLLVLGLVVCACGVAALARFTRPWIVVVLAVAGLVQVGGATVERDVHLRREVKNINDLQVRTAHWIAAHTAPDARIATNDIGAIAFFSRRYILDTEGLVSPDAIWDKRMWRIDRFLERSKPDVVVIFPHWYPYLARRLPMQEVTRFSAPVVIAGGPSLVDLPDAVDARRPAVAGRQGSRSDDRAAHRMAGAPAGPVDCGDGPALLPRLRRVAHLAAETRRPHRHRRRGAFLRLPAVAGLRRRRAVPERVHPPLQPAARRRPRVRLDLRAAADRARAQRDADWAGHHVGAAVSGRPDRRSRRCGPSAWTIPSTGTAACSRPPPASAASRRPRWRHGSPT